MASPSRNELSKGLTTLPNRRRHRKSRFGCKECKQRHIRCDENQPSCFNCSNTSRQCSFLESRPLPKTSTSLETSQSPAPSQTSVTEPHDVLASTTEEPTFTAKHLILLYHAESDMLKDLGIDETHARDTWRVIFKCALDAPYLMDQILALSAARLSVDHADQRSAYRNEATILQTRGLSLFKTAEAAQYSESKILARLLYSSFLGLHVLFETLLSRADFNTFLDDFSSYLSLHRGIRAVIPEGAFDHIRSQLPTLFGDYDFDMTSLNETDSLAKHSCDPLWSLIEAVEMGPTATIACEEAVHSLERAYVMSRRGKDLKNRINHVVAWTITLPADFLGLLKQRRPEPMVILAHYAVLLHEGRQFWVFGDGGQFLIQSIKTNLGAYWEKWLSGPIQALAVD